MGRLSGAERTRRWRERKAREAAEARGATAPVAGPAAPETPAASAGSDAAGDAPSIWQPSPAVQAALSHADMLRGVLADMRIDEEGMAKMDPHARVKVIQAAEAALKVRLQNAKFAGQYVDRDDARSRWTDALTALRERLLMLATEVGSKLGAVVTLTDAQQAEIVKLFDVRIRDALGEIARTSAPRRAA